MASITSAGIGSGLDITSLVAQLVAAERAPTDQRLFRKEAKFQTQLSAVGTLKGALSSLQSALTNLKDADFLKGRTATSGDTSVFTASAGASAVPGTFQIEVERLATSHKVVSQGITDKTANLGTGTLTIGVGADSFTVSIGAAAQSLEDIRDAINDSSNNPGVGATIISVDDGLGGKVSKLVLESENVGSDYAITLTVDDDDGVDADDAGLSRVVFGNTVGSTATLDAVINIDGQAHTATSNSITDAVEGVTINLVSATDPALDEVNALTIKVDTAVVKKEVQKFVAAYNDFIKTFDSMASFNAETQETGVLLGDTTLRSLRSQLALQLGDVVSTATGDIDVLTELGVTTTDQGTLTIDDTKFSEVLDTNFADLESFFASDSGFAVRLDSMIESYVASDGVLEAKSSGLKASIESINEDRERLNRRIASFEARILKQFTALDTLISQFQSTGTFLTQQLAALPQPNQISKD